MGMEATIEAAIENYSGAVREVSNLPDLQAVTYRIMHDLGFSDFILSPGRFAGTTAFDRQHVATYLSEGFSEVDPVAQRVVRSWSPVAWDYRHHLSGQNPRCAELFERSREVGYRCGISLLINGPAGQRYVWACIFDGKPDTFWKRQVELGHDLAILGPYLARTHHELSRQDRGAVVALTERERECLTWTSLGKTAWEIARIIGVRERTVNFHLQNAMTKLETSSKHHAWLKAVRLGMIEA